MITIRSGERYESGWGATKKEAERRAAELTLKKLTGETQEDGPPEEATDQE